MVCDAYGGSLPNLGGPDRKLNSTCILYTGS